MATFPDPEAALALSGAIREDVLSRLPELIEEFEKNAAGQGAKIIWARDAREANQFVVDLLKERGITYVAKGKSMVTEELGLNDVLKENGIEPFESDLGEFIAQQLDRPPFHIVGPALNVPVEEIRDLFLEKADMKEPTTDPVELGLAARLFLRDKFHNLEVGITGVNMAVAETGTIINVENEGNIRFVKSSPRIQVSIMSLEKVVPTMTDAMHLLRVLCRCCTGQKLAAYVSMDTGPKKPEETDGPEELYIVIVDNGRTRICNDIQARSALQCIRCGTCLMACPVYAKVGGYAYGWAYSGPMGQILAPSLLGLDKTRDLTRACSMCGECKRVCPAGINHPEILRYFRSMEVEAAAGVRGRFLSWLKARFFDLWAFGGSRAWRWNLGAKNARLFINRHAENHKIRKMGGPFKKWLKSRDLPEMPQKTFHEQWDEIKSKGKSKK